MKHLFITCIMIIAGISAASPTASVEVHMSVKRPEKNRAEKETGLSAGKIRAEKARAGEEIRLSVEKIRAETVRTGEELRTSVRKEAERVRVENLRIREERRTSAGKRPDISAGTDGRMNPVDEASASSEHKREIKRTFPAGSSASLSINNEFGHIRIWEGTDDKIIFNITITGKGKNSEDAKKYAESADVSFTHKGDDISAKTVFEKIRCSNCGRSVDYDVYVPQTAGLTLENRFGDIKINNRTKPLKVKLHFGKLYANEIADAEVTVQHGGSTINKCKSMKLESSFSKHKLGEAGTLSGNISHGGIHVEELGYGDLKSDFSNLNVGKLNHSLKVEKFSYGTLKIGHVDEHFSTITVDADFSKVQVTFTGNHNFKTALYTRFGSIKTGDIVFYEKILDKKDAVVGTAGKIKAPSAAVNISNSYGNIVLQ